MSKLQLAPPDGQYQNLLYAQLNGYYISDQLLSNVAIFKFTLNEFQVPGT